MILREILIIGQNSVNIEYYQDTIWLKSGMVIPCKIIEEQSDLLTVNLINENNDWVLKQFSKSNIIKYNNNPFNVNIEKRIIRYQNNSKIKLKIYDTWITLSNKSSTIKGILFEIYDSTIAIVTSGYDKKSVENNLNISIIAVTDISLIRLHRTNNPEGVIGSALLGAILGTIVGTPIWAAYAMENVSYNQNKPIIVASICAGIGAGIGILIHSQHRKKIAINESEDTYKILMDRLKKYSLVFEK
jgi:hypothetical protein